MLEVDEEVDTTGNENDEEYDRHHHQHNVSCLQCHGSLFLLLLLLFLPSFSSPSLN